MAESEEPDFTKLSLEDKLTHKVWKARVLGYEEAIKLFKRLDDENNPEYSKYVGLLKKFVTDSNAIAQEKALEATLVFVEYAACAGKVCADVVAGIVTKCLNARAKTKESAICVCLMYIETEKQEIVQEEIMKGFTNKQPKIVAACVGVLTRALREFGSSVMNMKPLLKSLSGLFEHSDKNVRAEAKAFALEIYRWIGPTLITLIKDKVKPVQLKELEEEIDKLPKEKVKPTRLLRSQQAQAPPTTAGGDDADEEEDEEDQDEDVGGGAQVDAYELIPAINVLAQLPADFEENITHTKWQQRKEALETLLKLTGNPKLEPGEYGELMRMLKKVVSKDTNVMLVALAGKAVTDLAKGLRKNFYPYASVMLTAIFEKFKEKKANVVMALREAADAIYLTTSMSNIQEELVTAMANKNPAARAEALLFMARSFQLCTPDMLSKPFLKAICPVIITQLGDTTPQVRDASAEAFATVWKVMGDRPMAAYLEGIDKIKMTKIEEFKEKVEIKAVLPKASKPKKAAAAAGSKISKKPAASDDSAQSDKSNEPVRKPVKKKPPVKEKEPVEDSEIPKEPPAKKPAKPKAAAAAAAAASKPSSGKSKGKGKAAAGNAVDAIEIPSEPSVANEEVEEKAKEVLPSSLLTQLASSNWKERLAACEEFQKLLEGMEPAKIQSLLFVKVLGFLKPGWKDSNFQVMKAKFSLVSTMVTTATVFGKRSTAYVLSVVVDKLADIKIKPQSIDTLMIMAEKFGLNFISTQVTKHAFEQKSPKVQSESLNWLSQAIKDFGFRIDVKSHIESVKKALAATNPTVRSSGITLLGVMHMYIGPQLRVFFDGEKSALLAQIDAEFEKTAGESPPAPTRGVAAAAGDEDDEDEDEDSQSTSATAAAKPQSLADIMPKVDISGQIKSSLIKELADKNWKVRGEALQKVADILKEAKFIEPSLGDLPGALKGRLSDANKNLVVTTLNILSTIANAMGSSSVKYVKVLMPGTMNVLSDSKGHVRQAAIDTLNAWLEQTSLVCFVEGELFSAALATDNPYLRTELYKWLSEKLPEAGKLPSELSAVVTPVFASLEDRSADVRKAAQLVLPPLTQHIGYDVMIKQAGRLKPASKQVVVGLLEKHKPTAPPPKSKAPPSKSAPSKQSPSEAAEPTATTTAAGKKGKTSAKSKAGDKAKEGSSNQSKSADDSEGGAPLIMSNKNQRAKDDQNLKMLKWNFAAPRGEHVDQLKEQFVPCANAILRSQLFHVDFKQHLVALSTLTQCIDEHNAETVANFDIILRWTTLRFFDTNTSVMLKCLEFLQSLFANLVTADYRMSDYEAYAFIPYLVLKVGDAKDPVRKGVRVLFGQVCCIYPPGKLFPYIVDGLKSKNSRQRSECLEELGLLIQNNGMVVCQPTPQKAVQVIAQQISDRDTNVRNAALNTLVIVYDNIGETVYKYAGQISPKDAGLLEERIKRSGKKPTAPATAAPPPGQSHQAKMPVEDKQQPKHAKQQQHHQRHSTPVEDEEVTPSNGAKEEKTIPTTKMAAQSGMKPPTTSVDPASQEDQATTAVESRPRVVTGPYKIDTSKYGKNSSIPTLGQGKWKDEHVDYSVIDEASNGIQTEYATSQLLINPPKTLAQSPARIASTSAAINYVISQINNSNTAETALHQMETYLTHADSTPSLVSHIDQLLRAVLMQLKATLQGVTQQSHGKEAEEKAMVLIKQLLSCILLVFSEGSLAVGASQDVLEEVQQQVMGYLLDERLNKLEEVAQIHRTFNLIMSRMLENSNKNCLFGSLLHLLSQSLNTDGESSPITQMVMKCLWKLTRKIPEILTSINVEELFLDLDKFFTYHTSLTTSPSDETPFRTVKTIIYHIVNIMGAKCMEHMTLIPKPKESAFWQYTRKSIAKKRASAGLGEEQQQQLLFSPSHSVKSHSPSPDGKSRVSRKPPETLKYSSLLSAKLPPGASKQLCDIFTSISSVERSKQGLLALHDFKQRYPEVDLTPIIQQNTKFLKGYIERGLKAIEQEKSGLPAHEHHDAEGVDEYTARLQSIEQLRLKASASMNINNWDKAGGSVGSSIKPPGTSLPSQHIEKSGRENKVPLPVATKHKEEEVETTASSLNLIDVRKRLDKLKTKT